MSPVVTQIKGRYVMKNQITNTVWNQSVYDTTGGIIKSIIKVDFI